MVFGNVFPPPSKTRTFWTMKRLCRSKVKVLVFLVLLTFLIVCIGPIFFLPDLRGGLSSKAENVYKAVKEIQKAAPELIIPPPPPQDNLDGYIRNHEGLKKKYSHLNDVHLKEDKLRLQNKINNEVLEKPLLINVPSTKNVDLSINKVVQLKSPIKGGSSVQNEVLSDNEKFDNNNKQVPPPQDIIGMKEKPAGSPLVQGGEDKDPETSRRRDKIKEVNITLIILF